MVENQFHAIVLDSVKLHWMKSGKLQPHPIISILLLFEILFDFSGENS